MPELHLCPITCDSLEEPVPWEEKGHRALKVSSARIPFQKDPLFSQYCHSLYMTVNFMPRC